MLSTETLLAETLLAELALAGRLQPPELRRWLTSLGVGRRGAVLVFALEDPEAGVGVLQAALARLGTPGLGVAAHGLLCAVVDCSPREPSFKQHDGRMEPQAGLPKGAFEGQPEPQGGSWGELPESQWAGEQEPRRIAARACSDLRKRFGEVPAAASRPAPAQAIARCFQEARCALHAARAVGGWPLEVASYQDLGAFQLLLSLQDGQTLDSYWHNVLGPLGAEEGDYGEELLRSLDMFIEHNGHWEQAARALYCHRHTLRYRVRRAEQLTGRDLSRARDRIELWLALRARELSR